MVKVSASGKTAANIKESTKTTKKMATASSPGKMAVTTAATGATVNNTDMAYTRTRKELYA